MKMRPVVLGLLTAVAVTGLGFGVANAVAGDDRPLTWTPPPPEKIAEAAKACEANPKDCPEDPLWSEFVEPTGFVPQLGPDGSIVGYVRLADLTPSDGTQRSTSVPVYSDSSARVQVGSVVEDGSYRGAK